MSVTKMRQRAVGLLDSLFQERDSLRIINSRPSNIFQTDGSLFQFFRKKKYISREIFFDQWPGYYDTWPAMEETPSGWNSCDSALQDIFFWIHAQITPVNKGRPDILVKRLPDNIWPIMGRIRAFMTTDLPFPNRDPRLPIQDLLLTIPLATNILDGNLEPSLCLTNSKDYLNVDWDDAWDLDEIVAPRSVQSIRRERFWPKKEDKFWPFTQESWTSHGSWLFDNSSTSQVSSPAVDRSRRNWAADLLDRACRERMYLKKIETPQYGPHWRERWRNFTPKPGFLNLLQFWKAWPVWVDPIEKKFWTDDPILPTIKSWLSCQHDAVYPFSDIMATCYEDAVWPILERCRRFLRTNLEFPAVEPAFVEFKPFMLQNYSRNHLWASVTWPPDARIWPSSARKFNTPDMDCSPNPWLARQERYWPLEGDEVWPFPPDTDPQYVRDLVQKQMGMKAQD